MTGLGAAFLSPFPTSRSKTSTAALDLENFSTEDLLKSLLKKEADCKEICAAKEKSSRLKAFHLTSGEEASALLAKEILESGIENALSAPSRLEEEAPKKTAEKKASATASATPITGAPAATAALSLPAQIAA